MSSNQRFFASTRGHIVLLLRRSARTVDEMARELNLTDNAVRAHLATLERDGLVYQSRMRHGSGKPSFLYELTDDADELFPRAYNEIMLSLLEVMHEFLPSPYVEDLMRQVGQRLASKWHLAENDLPGKLQQAVTILNGLGGLAELEQRDDGYYIFGYSCPFTALVPGHPEVCSLVETLLTTATGVPVKKCCGTCSSAQCCFIANQT